MICRVSERASRDLADIWHYIAYDNEPAADRFIALLQQHFQLLGRNPYLGRSRNELRRDYRSFPVGPYVVLYRVLSNGIEVMHVLHGKRDFDAIFETN